MNNNKNFLVVPMHLDALYLSEETQIVEGDAQFERLPYATVNNDINPDTPNISETITSPPFSSNPFFLQKGIHLHWALPDALTHGKQSTNRLEFPIVPNRWLVIRTTGTGVDQIVSKWIVESDYIYPENTPETPNSIAYPYNANGRIRPYTYLGRVRNAEGWEEDQTAEYLIGQTGKELTAIGYGHHNFSGFYPNCHSNFGFHDKNSGLSTTTDCTYEVLGWYSNAELSSSKDYLHTLLQGISGNNDKLAAIKEELQWAILNQSTAPIVPDASLYYAKLTLKANQFATANPRTTASNHKAIIGNTGTEALSAYLADRIKTSSSSATRQQIEEQIEAIQLLDDFNHQQLDLEAKFYEARHEKGFRKVDAGILWVVRSQTRDIARANATDNAQDHEQITLPAPLAHQLNLLNALQNEWSKTMAEIESYQKQLHADWYKYQVAKYPPTDQLFDYADPDSIEEFIRGKDLYPLQEKIEVVDNLQKQIQKTKKSLETALSNYNRLHTHAHLILQTKGAPRFYEANDPVVLFVGDALEATKRYGQDGRIRNDGLLGCVLLKGQNLASLRNNLNTLTTTITGKNDFTQIAVTERTEQPWNPLMLEWEVEIFPHEKGFNPINRSYEPTYIQDNYDLTTQGIDLKLKNGKGVVKSAKVFSGKTNLSPEAKPLSINRLRTHFSREFSPYDYTKTNTAALTNANLYRLMIAHWDQDDSVTIAIRTFYDQNTDVNVRTAMIENIQKVAKIADYPASTQYKAAENITINTAYFNNDDVKVKKLLAWHLVTTHVFDIESYFIDKKIVASQQNAYLDTATQVDALLLAYLQDLGANINSFIFKTNESAAPFIKSFQTSASVGSANHNLSKVYEILIQSGFHAQSQSLGGFNEALLMYKQTLNLPIADPLSFTSDEHTSFINAVKNCLAGSKAILNAPQPLEDFLPIRAGEMRIIRLRLIDTFGQTNEQLTLSDDKPVLAAESYNNSKSFDRVSLVPRLSQPARLNFRWLAARENREEFNQHPATTPICGWLIPNYLDQSLDIYDQHGAPLGIVRVNATWGAFPGSLHPINPGDISNTHLRKMVQYLLRQGQTFLNSFVSTLQTSLINIEPEYFSQHQDTALLIGRPLALVRAKLNLELRGLPAHHQGWNMFRQDLQRNFRQHDKFTQVKFPVRLGESQQLNDGLVGFWKERPDGTYDQNYFYAPQVGSDTHNNIRNNGEGINLMQSLDDSSVKVSMLVDVQGKIHATSGILPTKSIDIPKDQYQRAIKRMVATLRTMPVLTQKNAVALTLPSEEGYQWNWVEKQGGVWNKVPLEATVKQSDFTTKFGITKGNTLWNLLLKPTTGWLRKKGESSAYVFAENTQNLNTGFDGDKTAIEQLLAKYRKLLSQTTFINAYKSQLKTTNTAEARAAWDALKTAQWIIAVRDQVVAIAPTTVRRDLSIPTNVTATEEQLQTILKSLSPSIARPLKEQVFIQQFGVDKGQKIWRELQAKDWIAIEQRGYTTLKSLDTIMLPSSANTSTNLQETLRILGDTHATAEGLQIAGGKTAFLQQFGSINGKTIWTYLVNNGFIKVPDEVAYIVPVSERNEVTLAAIYDDDLPAINKLLNRLTIQQTITKIGFDNSLVLRDGWLTLTPTTENQI